MRMAIVPHKGYVTSELPVVIAIIAMVIAVLLPALHSLREAAKRAVIAREVKGILKTDPSLTEGSARKILFVSRPDLRPMGYGEAGNWFTVVVVCCGVALVVLVLVAGRHRKGCQGQHGSQHQEGSSDQSRSTLR